jgi:hypothetical protein
MFITVLKMFTKTLFFFVHDAKVMTEEIDLTIKKLPENVPLYPIMGQPKTSKLLLTRLKTKHNVIVL